jgi:elongation of very long chain fatty acids protein 7
LQDPRTYGDPFLASPFILMATMGLYVYIFTSLGPKLMKNRKPFNVKTPMFIYNVIQIMLNAFITYTCTKILYAERLQMCVEVDYSGSSNALGVITGKLYMYLKLFDAGDTLFFLLRKSFRQISFLHIYHHCGMMLATWVGVRYIAGGSALWIGLINSFVHCVMFSYYLLTVIDTSWKQSLVFKKSLTQLQIIQFFIFIIIFGKIVVWPTCNFPRILAFIFIVQNAFMLFLFGDFYLKTYVKTSKKV